MDFMQYYIKIEEQDNSNRKLTKIIFHVHLLFPPNNKNFVQVENLAI